jgi:hypothetical protein
MAGHGRFEFIMEYMLDPEVLEYPAWINVVGGGLTTPIAVRVGKDRDGRPIISGLIVGDRSPTEITSDSLRAIRVGAILKQLFEGFDPSSPPKFHADLGDQIEWHLMHEHVWKGSALVESATGRGPSSAELKRFADIYRQELVRDRNRAIAATANILNISPATAHRRVAACRAQGLLPPKR